MRKINSRTTIVLAAALFVSAAPSVVMAQEAGTTVGNTGVQQYNGQDPGGQYPVEFAVQYHERFVGASVGNGAAGAATGTVSPSGHVHSAIVSTQAPTEACMLVPGTDIPYDCSH